MKRHLKSINIDFEVDAMHWPKQQIKTKSEYKKQKQNNKIISSVKYSIRQSRKQVVVGLLCNFFFSVFFCGPRLGENIENTYYDHVNTYDPIQ